MTKEILKISSIVDGKHWIDPSEGGKVFDRTKELISSNVEVILDFDNKDFVITAFLNAAIGPLYSGEFSEAQISLVTFTNTTGDDDELLKRVKDNALLYYSNQSDVDGAWKEEFDEE